VSLIEERRGEPGRRVLWTQDFSVARVAGYSEPDARIFATTRAVTFFDPSDLERPRWQGTKVASLSPSGASELGADREVARLLELSIAQVDELSRDAGSGFPSPVRAEAGQHPHARQWNLAEVIRWATASGRLP
jgi:hypothetical protein